jgi:hypothetical protein
VCWLDDDGRHRGTISNDNRGDDFPCFKIVVVVVVVVVVLDATVDFAVITVEAVGVVPSSLSSFSSSPSLPLPLLSLL